MEKGRHVSMIEMLLVVSVIVILSAVVVAASNPEKKLATGRNNQRISDTSTILSMAYQYSIDHQGVFPGKINSEPTEICKTGSSDCSKLIDFTKVTADKRYFSAVPMDPKGGISPNGTGYQISRDSLGRVTVRAPKAEYGETVSVSR